MDLGTMQLPPKKLVRAWMDLGAMQPLPARVVLMDDIEIASLALNSLSHRRLRSWLAALGIVIAVASIISFISISVGIDETIRQSLSSLGSNIITVSPGGMQAQRFGGGGGFVSHFQTGGQGKPITFRQADSLRGIAGIEALDARVGGNGQISYRNRNSSAQIVGTEPAAFPKTAGVALLSGRWLRAGDTYSAVAGFSIANDTFNDTLLDRQIKIRGIAFRVVGILNKTGASFNSPDNSLYIPQKTTRELFNKSENADSIYIAVSPSGNAELVAASVSSELQRLRRVSAENQDFRVITASQTQSALSQVTGSFAIFIAAISSISLVVGVIGVANAMFTSVLEQTRFIGILRSLGARKKDVMKLFLYESCLLGMAGGVIGVLLSFLGSIVIAAFGLPSKITVELVLLGVLSAAIAGAVSGIVPARNASEVEPVEALRYE